MGNRGRRLAAGLLLVASIGPTGCGSGGATRETFSATTSTGLTYNLEITGTGAQQCTTTTIRAALPNGKPGLETSHFCGAPAVGHPLLIQAHSSSRSMVVDLLAAGCGKVEGGSTHATTSPLVTRCSTTRPVYRVTILPAEPRVALTGLPTVPVINFSRHPCRIICITALS